MTKYALGVCDPDIPDSYAFALNHPEREKWIEAAKTEMEDL